MNEQRDMFEYRLILLSELRPDEERMQCDERSALADYVRNGDTKALDRNWNLHHIHQWLHHHSPGYYTHAVVRRCKLTDERICEVYAEFMRRNDDGVRRKNLLGFPVDGTPVTIFDAQKAWSRRLAALSAASADKARRQIVADYHPLDDLYPE